MEIYLLILIPTITAHNVANGSNIRQVSPGEARVHPFCEATFEPPWGDAITEMVPARGGEPLSHYLTSTAAIFCIKLIKPVIFSIFPITSSSGILFPSGITLVPHLTAAVSV
ncbi:hypothetical protein CEXT_576071 [Caerostris extrusa]|uniref:Secreted protein n=1 Tax=Caerostris extrusa TaxID=172846 RepID=A0AAV4XS89_CAEEX|nr:hypothetical protein CEXT_576071 [Caerostris extrusa]